MSTFVKKAAKDVIKALMIGIVTGAILGILFFAGGFLCGGFRPANGLEVMKDGLLLISSLGLFLVAGMLLVKGKKENADEKKEAKNGWRRHFSVIGLKTVVLLISIALVFFASAADYLLLHM